MRDLAQRKAGTHVERESAVSEEVSEKYGKIFGTYSSLDWRISRIAQTLQVHPSYPCLSDAGPFWAWLREGAMRISQKTAFNQREEQVKRSWGDGLLTHFLLCYSCQSWPFNSVFTFGKKMSWLSTYEWDCELLEARTHLFVFASSVLSTRLVT